MTHSDADLSPGQSAALRAAVRHAEVNPVGDLTRVGDAHLRSFRGIAQEAVRCAENPSEGILIVGSHNLTTVIACAPTWPDESMFGQIQN